MSQTLSASSTLRRSAARGLAIGIDPLGGAGVHYWGRIAERYGLNLTVVNETVDPQFAFMSVDWDGKIRMDPSSAYAMQRLIALKDRYDIAAACDTDHDRHGVVAPSVGLLPANHYLAVMIEYLFGQRPGLAGCNRRRQDRWSRRPSSTASRRNSSGGCWRCRSGSSGS